MTASVVTHIAGLAVLIGHHGVQRCAWCGTLLFEVDGDTASSTGSPYPRPWKEGDYVQVTSEGNVTGYIVLGNGAVSEKDDLPFNICAGHPRKKSPPTLRLVKK